MQLQKNSYRKCKECGKVYQVYEGHKYTTYVCQCGYKQQQKIVFSKKKSMRPILYKAFRVLRIIMRSMRYVRLVGR